MGKLGKAYLEIVEEWTPIDPNDPEALAEEGRKLRFVISLLLKARDRELLEQVKATEKENERIRQRAGLVP